MFHCKTFRDRFSSSEVATQSGVDSNFEQVAKQQNCICKLTQPKQSYFSLAELLCNLLMLRHNDPNWPISINLDTHQGQFIPEAKPQQPLGRRSEVVWVLEPQLPPNPCVPPTWDPNESRGDEVGSGVDWVGWGSASFSCGVPARMTTG